MRIRLLEALRRREQTVTDLVAAMGATQASVSKHLAVLHGLGFVALALGATEAPHILQAFTAAALLGFYLCFVAGRFMPFW